MEASGNPSILVIFGITGDLAQRKLLPALYRVLCDGLLPSATHIVGVTRQNLQPQDAYKGVEKFIKQYETDYDPQALKRLTDMTELFQMDLAADEDYRLLLRRLHQLESKYPHAARLYYLSIPPQVFLPVVRRLGEQGHAHALKAEGDVRLLIEKPFGYDLPSAQELITEVGQYFAESQLYRIDHYLAKETAQNILTLRFSNPIFEAVWDKDCIEHIEVLATEVLGVEGRAAFYEHTGALRDLLQSHLLQLLALTTMERPKSLVSDDIHAAKLALLQAIEPIEPHHVTTQTVRGQYRGYREEIGNTASLIETFAALHLQINNKRWQGVPIILKTGKYLQRKSTEITICFKDTAGNKGNKLTFRLQPNEGITLELQAKQPGFASRMSPVDMQFDYATAFADRQPDAYERVLVDALRGDRTLFATSEEVIASWRVLQNVVTEWAKSDAGLQQYEPGSRGPILPERFD